MKLLRVFVALTLMFLFPATAAFADSTSTSVYLMAWENSSIDYTVPEGYLISSVDFASYGTPTTEFTVGACNAEDSLDTVNSYTTDTTLQIDANNDTFGDPCGGTYKWLEVLLTIDLDPDYVAPTPEPTDTATPEPTDTVLPTPEPTDILPTPEPTPSDTPTVDPTPTPEPTPSETVEPTPTPTSTPEPTPASPSESPTPQASPTPVPVSVVIPSITPSPSDTPTPDVTPTPDPTPTDAAAVADALVTQYAGTAIPADVFAASGLTYADLPPDQPVTLPNGVVLTASVADAIQIFNSASAVLSAVFTDPGKALKAIANVGADMTPKARKKAQQAVVPAVIVTQIISGTASLLIRKP